MESEQEALRLRLTPLRLTEPVVALAVPPQVLLMLPGFVTWMLAGRLMVAVNPTPLMANPEFGLPME